MGCPLRVRASILRVAFTLVALSTIGACSGGNSESGSTGTGGSSPFSVEVS
jgi:hypothetical protein